MKKLLAAGIFLLSGAMPGHAQLLTGAIVVTNCATLGTTYTVGINQPVTQDLLGRECANTAPFLPSGQYTAVASVTGTPANSALPSGANAAQTAVIYNTGANAVMIKLSNAGSPAVSASTFDALVQPNTSQALGLGAFTNINYATQSGSSSLQIVYGNGLYTSGSGGGGGGGTAGGATAATQGTTTDAPFSPLPATTAAATQVALAKATLNVLNSVNVTPADCSGTVGTTAANLSFGTNANLHGFTIVSLKTSEEMDISLTGTAVTPANAGTYALNASTPTYTTPPGFGTNHAVSVIAAAASHPYTCTYW